MIEIGAGTGVLTSVLAETVRLVRAIEVAPWHASKLRRRFEASDRIEILEADFFATEFPRERYSVFANIPFARTAEIMRHLTEAQSLPEDIYLVVQAEAAARFAGLPYGRESVASLVLKPWWHLEVEHWFRRNDFSPPPAVDSVLLHLAHRARPLIEMGQRDEYVRLIERSFGRGDVGRGLRGHYSGREQRALGDRLRFDLRAPPSMLSFEQWLGLFRQQGGPERR